MANLPWSYELRPGQRSNPVVFQAEVSLDSLGLPCPSDAELAEVFRTSGFKLQTWARAKDEAGRTILTGDPHWIAVRGGTPLHHDPRYPRYSHHLKLRVDPGVLVRGLDKEELPLKRGTYYVLDAHSPHQVLATEGKRAYNVAASIDSHEVIDFAEALPPLLHFAASRPFLPFR